MSTPTETPNLWTILAESRRIIKSSRHFLTLSIIFLLPNCLRLIIYPILQPNLGKIQNIFLYNLFWSIYSLLSIGTITYSTYNVYYGRPVNFLESIKSLGHSFIPLLSTLLATLTLQFCIFFVFFLLMVLVAQILGTEIDYQSTSFIVFVVALFVVWLLYLQVNFVLANVVAVVESKWGFEPLWRSAYLVKGARMVSFWLILLYSVLIGLFSWGYKMWATTVVGVSGWKSWGLVLQAVVGSSFMAMLMLHYLAAITVLFIYCKALHGELASKEEEFGSNYISLSFDDDKKLPRGVPPVV